ncbi:unnamed protein product [Pleuronectes platessa]|uniref:Uncharacterized protein n=1 Tax=Pleuronectes platessa TaxID=8262 RepID=A0A9N7YUU1_PLEPL|nr:unnamed protein product [Pleuronectes platessa]
MTARPRPPHDRTCGFRKGGEQSQSCGVHHRPHSISPPPSAEAPRCQVRRPSEQAGKGARRGVEVRRKRHRTVVDSAQTKWRRKKNRRSGGRWEITRVPHQHNPGLVRHAGPGVQRDTLSTCGGGFWVPCSRIRLHGT